MLSRDGRIVRGGLAAVLIAGAGAAWWKAEQWTPYAGPWAAHMWRKITRTGSDTLPRDKAGRPAPTPTAQGAAGAASAPIVQPRKCVKRPGDLHRPALPTGQPRADCGWGDHVLALALSGRGGAHPFTESLD